jgi:hypothetical protein
VGLVAPQSPKDGGYTDAVLIPDGRVYLRTGRYSGFPGPPIPYRAFVYDTQTNVLQARNELIPGTPILLSDGQVLFANNSSTSTFFNEPSYFYNPVSDLREPAGVLNDKRVNPTAVLLNDGRVLVVGGGGGAVMATGEVFTPPGIPGNPAPNVGQSMATEGPAATDPIQISISGSNFLPNSIVTLNQRRLTSIYMGAQNIAVFVPASLRSLLDTVPVVVTNPTPGGGSTGKVVAVGPSGPRVTGITPNRAFAGTTISAVLSGSSLDGITAVSFNGTGVTAVITDGATSTAVPIRITLLADAPVGLRSVTVVAPAGVFSAENIFTVLPANPTVPSTAPLPITDVEQGAIRTGYMIVTPDPGTATPTVGEVFGMVDNATVLSQGGILPSSLTTDASVYVDIVPAASRNLGLALVNPSDSASTISLTLRNDNGSTVSTMSLSLAPRQQIARFVSELFSQTETGTAFRGNLRLQGTAPFSVIGLRFTGVQFGAVPVTAPGAAVAIPTRTLAGGASMDSPRPGIIGGPGASLFPQFAISGGWASQVNLVNTGTAPATGRIDILDSNGNPMAVRLNDAIGSTFTYSLAPGASLILAPRDSNGQTPL